MPHADPNPTRAISATRPATRSATLAAVLVLALAPVLAQTQKPSHAVNPSASQTPTQPQAQPQTQPPTSSPAASAAQSHSRPQSPPPLAPTQLRIRVINAKTSRPVTDERLNIWLHAEQIGSTPLATDKNGAIVLDAGSATTIRVLSNFYADCRPRSDLYTDYPIATIHASGITGSSLCHAANTAPTRPGELVLFVIPKVYIRTMGQPPATDLPHSDENPN